MLYCDLEVGKGGVELRKPVDKALRAGTLVVRGIVVLYTRCEDFVEFLEVMAVDDLTHMLLRCDVRFFAHRYLWLREMHDSTQARDAAQGCRPLADILVC